MNPADYITRDIALLSLLRHRVKILRDYLSRSLFGAQINTNLLDPSDLNWLKSLPPDLTGGINTTNLNQVFSDIDNKITKIDVLTMYLPFEITQKDANDLGLKTRIILGKILLLDIKYNPSLIAGTALVFKGIYKDYSLKARIDQKKSDILQSFKKFLT